MKHRPPPLPTHISTETWGARIYGISYAGTPYILIRAVFQGLITKEKAKQAINEMIFVGWRCSIESYAKIIDAIEKL